MNFSTVAELNYHHHNLIFEHFHHPKRRHVSICHCYLLSPSPCAHTDQRSAFFGHFVEPHNTWAVFPALFTSPGSHLTNRPSPHLPAMTAKQLFSVPWVSTVHTFLPPALSMRTPLCLQQPLCILQGSAEALLFSRSLWQVLSWLLIL